MRILFIGNSIIRGTVGVDYIKFLSYKYPLWKIENAGVNGETLTKISERLINKLEADPAYDAIVLEAGYNDILLPSYAHKGFFFKYALKELLNKGYNPLECPIAFEKSYRSIITYIQAKSNAKIILTTLGCINENLRFELNIKRKIYNNIIRNISREYNCFLADVSGKFDKILTQQPTRDYCLENFFDTAYLDLIRCKLFHRADKLSRQRKLHLTIDGVHLNSRGAEIFMKEIEKHLILSISPL